MFEAQVIPNVQSWNDRTASSDVRVTWTAPRVASLEEVQLSKETVSRESEQADASVAEITAMSMLYMQN